MLEVRHSLNVTKTHVAPFRAGSHLETWRETSEEVRADTKGKSEQRKPLRKRNRTEFVLHVEPTLISELPVM